MHATQPRTVNPVAQPSINTQPWRRVTTADNPGPRAGLFVTLGAILRSIARCFSRGEPQEARLRPRPAQAGAPAERFEHQLEQRIAQLDSLLTSGKTTPTAIAAALRDSVASAEKLRRAGGRPHDTLQNYRISLKAKPDADLFVLVRAFQGATVEAAQRLSEHESDPLLADGAQYLLMNLEQAVLKELNDRLSANGVRPAVAAAVDSMLANESSARIGDQLHAAFESALPLLKAGVRRAAPAQDDIDQAVLLQLSELPQTQLQSLLPHIRSEDLASLTSLWTPEPDRIPESGEVSGPLIVAKQMIEAEIAARVPRLADEFRERAQTLYDHHDWIISSHVQIDHKALQNDLVALAASLAELEAHCRLHRIENPLTGRGRAQLRESVADLTARAFRPPHGSAENLDSRDLVRVSSALQALALPAIAPQLRILFRPAHQACLQHQQQIFRERFSEFAAYAMNAANNPAAARQLLHALAELEEASRALQEAHMAFDWEDPEHRPSSSKASGPPLNPAAAAESAQAELMLECLAQSPAHVGLLGAQLGSNAHQGLIAALHVGAELAAGVRERRLEMRFANMAHLYQQMADATGANPAGASGPAGHRKLAAESLPAAVRRVLSQDYGLVVPVDRPPTLQSGRFTATQTRFMAQLFERPPSLDEATLVQHGAYLINRNFRLDAQRHFRVHVDIPRSAPPGDPAPAAARHLRPLARSAAAAPTSPLVAQASLSEGATRDPEAARQALETAIENTFRDLVSLCGGDEKLANTIAMYANQQAMAAFILTCEQADPPVFQLQDGTPGRRLDNVSLKDQRLAPRVDFQVSVSIGAGGRPQLDVDYRIEGRATFVGVDDSHTILSQDSRLQVHIRAEVDVDGRLRLLEAPSYQFDLHRDDFQKPYRPPTVGDVLAAADDDALLEDLQTYGASTGTWPYVAALRALDRFNRRSTRENAAAVVAACDMPPGSARSLIPFGLRAALLGEESGATLAPALFGNLEQRMRGVLENEVLSGMIDAVRQGRV